MKNILKLTPFVYFCFVGCLCLSTQIWAAPPSAARVEQLARDKDFLQKAIAGKLDCAKEISQRELEFSKGKSQVTKVYDVHYWRMFGTQQCFRALLKAKAFDTAQQFVESSKQDYLNEWWALALEDSVDVPVYATEGKCKTGEERYEGNESDRLMSALLKGRDLGETPPGGRGDMEPVLVRMSNLEEYPACVGRDKIVDLINKMLDRGLQTTFWWEEPMVVGGLTTFSGIMRLGDVNLARRILTGGLKQEKRYWIYVYARAPSLEMVKLLEQYFKLQKSEYKKVLQIIDAEKKFPESVRKYGAGMASDELVDYFKRNAQ